MSHSPRNKGLPLDWVKHLPKDEQESFAQIVKNSTTALSRLKDILDEQLRDLAHKETKISEYDSPAWSSKQAHRNGQFAAIKKLRDLLSFLD